MTIIYDNTHDMANFVTAVQEHNNYPHQTHYRTVNLQNSHITIITDGRITITERSYYYNRTVILQNGHLTVTL